ncbi:MAG: DUF1376 domain-containing protein [Verrucomicrobiae bacterium]|nr:DUF1376 domain-containing protein [Verrucomicrobiae bacterium]
MSDDRMPYMKFFPADYVRDTRLLSLAARGAWMDLLCHMWHPDRRGTVRHPLPVLARLLQIPEGEAKAILEEIAGADVGDVEWLDGGVVSVSCRRIARDWGEAADMATRRESHARHAAKMRWGSPKDSRRMPGASPPQSSPHSAGTARGNADALRGESPEQCPSNAQTCHSRSQKPYASIPGPNWEGHSDVDRREVEGTPAPISPSAPPCATGEHSADPPDPPGLPEVLDFARGPADIDPKVAETWWHEVEGRGWRDGRGQPIDPRRWRNALTAYALKWRANERRPPGDRQPLPRLVENIQIKELT